MNETAPLLARIAGLEASVVEPLASPLCAVQAGAIIATEQELDEVRSHLVDKLHEEIHGAPFELRRLLLTVKRDSFNRRSLSKHRAAPLWPDLSERIGPLAERALELERKLADCWESFRRDFESESDQQTRHLCSFVLAEKRLLRGIALAGPSMIDDLSRFVELGRPTGAKQKKLAISLSRYVSRAALKLSPNSTLTRSALGTITQEPITNLKLSNSGWQERSLLRLRRMYVDQWRDMLLHQSEFRASLSVALNESTQEIEPGRFRWLRPGRWERNDEGTDLCFMQDAFVTARFDGQPFRCILSLLENGPSKLPDLLAELAGEAESERAVMAAELDRMLDLGFLRFRLPWPEDEPHVELRLLHHLQTLPQLAEIADSLEDLVDLQLSYADITEPEWALREMAKLSAQLTRSIGDLAGLDLSPLEEYRRGRLYEDVLLSPRPGRDGLKGLVQVPRAAVERAVESVEPLIALAFLYSHRHDFLHAIAELASRQFPQQRTVSLLDLFSAAQPLWREYTRFITAAMEYPDGWRSSFNPFGLAAMAELDQLRQTVWDGLGSCVEAAEHAEVLSAPAVTDLLSLVPRRYAPLVGLCLFLQPLDDRGELWFLNRMHEGVGRYGSRFTAVMDDSTRSRYTDYLASRAPFDVEGEPLELLDLMCSQGDTLNVHAVQTPWVLDIHGRGLRPSSARSLHLRDLRIELAGPRGLLWLTDTAGHRCLPVHLGGASHAFMPMIVKFLSLFGPGEFRSVWPPRRMRQQGETEVLERLRIGNVVFGRKRWSFSLRSIAEILSAPDPEAYVALQRWRLLHCIPEKVFLQERIPHRVLADRFKPQYLDLRSPFSLPVLRAAIETSSGSVSFDEMLPALDAFPTDAEGKRWAVELLVDSLALHPRRRDAALPLEPTHPQQSPLASLSTQQPEPATAHL